MNNLYYISGNEIEKIKAKLNHGGIYIVELDGNEIENISQFLKVISEAFNFPVYAKSLDGYLDWIRDLSWIHTNGFLLIIQNFKTFLKNDPNTKNEIIEDFSEIILPWWNGEIEQYQVEGKAKPFHVLLVD